MQYIGYYRVSTKEQGLSGLGLESQTDSVRKYVASVAGNLIKEFTEVASGSKDTRIKLNAAIIACQDYKAVLVVKKLDRLSRGGYGIAVRLDDLGVKYIESDSPNDNELLKDMKLAMAKDERKKVSERTKAALAAKKARGETLGNIKNLSKDACYKGGQAMKTLKTLNLNNQRAKSTISLLEGNGMTLQQKADYLNAHGFTTSRGNKFYAIQVSRLS